jgi:hypothetical protein
MQLLYEFVLVGELIGLVGNYIGIFHFVEPDGAGLLRAASYAWIANVITIMCGRLKGFLMSVATPPVRYLSAMLTGNG